MRKPRVCIVLEGSYPFITGGVSAWTHDLIINLPEVDFVLFTISPEEDMELRYELPQNVIEHKDIVLNKHYKSTAKPAGRKKLLQTIKTVHEIFESNSSHDFAEFISNIPEGFFMYDEAVKTDIGWDMIVEASQRNNPSYAFTDYYWAWKSAYDMLFTILGASLPDADMYHAISTGFAGIAAGAAKVRKKKPLILTEHGLYHKEREMEIRKSSLIRGYQRDMWTKLYNSFSRICYSQADMIISLFEENRRKQHELGADPKITSVIPNGIDLPRFSIDREEKEGFHVGLVGRVVPIKDIKTYISTAKIVLDRLPDTTFYCIGPTDEDPAYYKDCERLVKSLKIEDRFIFTGRQNVLEYYKFLNVLLLTSVREAQPLVILEGYCGGVPAVATAVGNIPEMLDYDDRFLAPSKDSVKLAECIEYIYSHPGEMEKINKANKQKAETYYNKVDLHHRYHDIYSGFMEQN
ncbi:MAG: GT4 family glycosyltransferase PelF [Spirochaetales bacterium]|uniref:GT4 family glycosyltransferase PelF n=1 Tax=Candidatus Thalassospirochaeta sargassi TaxID=3119039 RepID=A0AAJ1IC72_9SPIO|nr:GT4 family glycosyltransferase PelF [Spirochaetales bacterium]